MAVFARDVQGSVPGWCLWTSNGFRIFWRCRLPRGSAVVWPVNKLATQPAGVFVELDYLLGGVSVTKQLLVVASVMLAESLVEAYIRVFPVGDDTASFAVRFARRARIALLATVYDGQSRTGPCWSEFYRLFLRGSFCDGRDRPFTKLTDPVHSGRARRVVRHRGWFSQKSTDSRLDDLSSDWSF